MRTEKIVACLALASLLGACGSSAYLLKGAVQGDGPAEVAADYLATLCTLTAAQRDEVLPALNASIAPHTITLNCAQ